MPLVFAGVCSHAPGITGRAERADPSQRNNLYKNFLRMQRALKASGAVTLIVIGAEHFANFFMDNMPAFCLGMANSYRGPIEDEKWLGIKRHQIPGAPEVSHRLITSMMNYVDLAYAEEWQFDHGIMVPLHFLTPNYDMPVVPVNINCQGPPLPPLHRVWEFGKALREACDLMPEKLAVIGTGGLSHWPATPDSGKINEAWDREFLDRFVRNDREALLSYTDKNTYKDGGQGGFEIRTFVAVAGATGNETGEIWCYEPIPIFAVGCTVAVKNIC